MRLFTKSELENGVNTAADIPLIIQDQLRIGNYRYITDSAHELEL